MIEPAKEQTLSRIKSRLEFGQEKGDKFNFSCPFCGEGKSYGRKQRAFILRNRKYNFYCHNCGVSMSFGNFLKLFDYQVFKDYLSSIKDSTIDDFINGDDEHLEISEVKDENIVLKDLDYNFQKAVENIDAYNYLQKRKIPAKFWDDIWFFNKNKALPWNNSIIFPMRKDNKIYGFISRNIYTKFFHIELVDDKNPKIWNLFNIDKSLPVYVCESIMDAILLPNSIAMNGADISEEYLKQIQNPLFVFDNDETGVIKTKKYIFLGYNVFVWPDLFKIGGDIKDLNDIAKKNIELTKIKRMIDNNKFKGKEAEIKIKLRELI